MSQRHLMPSGYSSHLSQFAQNFPILFLFCSVFVKTKKNCFKKACPSLKIVLRLLLFLSNFQPRCSDKIVLIEKACNNFFA